jgi:integrase
MKAKLTMKGIADLVCTPGKERIAIGDTACPGLELRITSAGGKSWALRYYSGSALRRLTLGSWPKLTVDEARRLARAKLGEVAEGRDPALEARHKRRSLTLGALRKVYLERRSAEKAAGTAKADARRLALLGDLAARPATAVTRTELALWLAACDDRPMERNRRRALVSALYNWGEREGLLPENHPNPARGIPRRPEKPRKRTLSGPELQRVIDALDPEPEGVQALIWALLLTGCRKSEWLNAKWSGLLDSATGGKVLHLAETKNGDFRNVPIPAPLWAMLEKLPRTKESPYIFASPVKPSQPFDDNWYWRRIRERAGLLDVHLHDLRATVATRLAIAGASELAIQAVLGHRSTIAARVYVRDAQTLAQDALTAHAAAVASLTGGGRG